MIIFRDMLVMLSLVFSCLSFAGDGLHLTPAWETEATLKEPESVAYDILRRKLYVSNINGAPDAKDTNGFISLVSLDGSIDKLDWITGLNAPKGLAVRGNQLFVADIDELLVADLKEVKITKRFKAHSESFLNDVAVASDGTVYVTDTANNRIYRLYKGEFSVWLESPALESPNGLYVDNTHLYVAAWGVPTDGWKTEIPGHILQISLANKKVNDFGASNPIGNLDGIAKLSHDTFIVSDWFTGDLFKVDKEGNVSEIINTAPGAADFLLSRGLKLLVVPSMKEGLLRSFEFSKLMEK